MIKRIQRTIFKNMESGKERDSGQKTKVSKCNLVIGCDPKLEKEYFSEYCKHSIMLGAKKSLKSK